MEPGISALILICSAALAIPDCTTDTATDMLQGMDANTPIECLMNSEALIAQSALEAPLEKDEYLKIVCVQKIKMAGILQRFHGTAPPRPGVHPTHHLPPVPPPVAPTG